MAGAGAPRTGLEVCEPADFVSMTVKMLSFHHSILHAMMLLQGFKFGLYVGVPISLYIFVAYFPEGLDFFVRKVNEAVIPPVPFFIYMRLFVVLFLFFTVLRNVATMCWVCIRSTYCSSST